MQPKPRAVIAGRAEEPRRSARLKLTRPPQDGLPHPDPKPPPAKRSRHTRASTQQQPGVGGGKDVLPKLLPPAQTPARGSQQAPGHPKRSYFSFLQNSAGQPGPEALPPPKRAKRAASGLGSKRTGRSGGQKQTAAPPRPSRLTKQNLRLLDNMTKSARTGSSSESRSSKTTSTSSTAKTTKSDKSISTTTSGFQEQATANGILRPLRSMPPKNAKATLERLNRSRGTASPPESQYQLYCEKIEAAGNEAAVVQRMLPLFKEYDGKYNIDMNRAFSALPKDLGFNDGLSAPQPDFVQGLTKEEFVPVDPTQISGAVLFKDDLTSTTLPHFAGEWKSRSGDMDEATLQSGYDGAAMVYGRGQAREYLGQPDASGHSAITTFASNGEHITFFAHHASPTGANGALQYHQHRLVRTDLTDSYESFKKGWRQIRNAQDYAREQSLALRDELRVQWQGQQGREEEDANGADGEVPDDDAGPEAAQKPCQPSPPASSKRERKASQPKARPSRRNPARARRHK